MNIEKMTKPLGNLEIVGDVICLRLFQESDISDTYVSW